MMIVRIDTHVPQLTVRNVSQLLGAFAILRDGLELIVEGDREAFLERFANMPGLDDPEALKELLESTGSILIEQEGWPSLSAIIQNLISQALLQNAPAENDVGLTSVKAGSLEIDLGELTGWLNEELGHLLTASVNLMKGEGRNEFKEAVRKVADASEHSLTTRRMGAGVIVVGAVSLARAYATMQADNITIEASRMEDDSQASEVEDTVETVEE